MRLNDILQDIQTIAEDIGPRPPHSQNVLDALHFVKDRLQTLGFEAHHETFFSSVRAFGRWAPAALITATGLWLSGLQNQWIRPLGVSLMGLAAWGAHEARSGSPAWYEQGLVQHPAENLIVTIPAANTVTKRLICVAHIDTDRQQHPLNSQLRTYIGDACNIIEKLPTIGMTLPLGRAIWSRRLMIAATIAQLVRLQLDEQNDAVKGANDNASGVALLLALATALQSQPLQHTEVVLAFTEADTLNARGLEALMRAHQDDWKDASWIVVDSVGAGELCWVVNNTTRPARPMEVVINRLANKHRDWGLFGRPLDIADPAAPLQNNHMDVVTLMGYQRDTNHPPNWRESSDATDMIEHDTVAKAWDILWQLVQAVEDDSLD